MLEKDTNEQHKYQWRLFEALLLRINEETIKQRATLIVVGIPYLPQVYDDLWERTFGTNPKYSRTVATERVALFCKANGILYVETLGDFQNKYKTTGTWLHYRKDAHPTPQGQELIADAVLKTVTLTPVKRASE